MGVPRGFMLVIMLPKSLALSFPSRKMGPGENNIWAVAQWLEQSTHNALVPGSSPGGPTISPAEINVLCVARRISANAFSFFWLISNGFVVKLLLSCSKTSDLRAITSAPFKSARGVWFAPCFQPDGKHAGYIPESLVSSGSAFFESNPGYPCHLELCAHALAMVCRPEISTPSKNCRSGLFAGSFHFETPEGVR